MVSGKPHPAELRERVVKMVFELRAETGNARGSIARVSLPWRGNMPGRRASGPSSLGLLIQCESEYEHGCFDPESALRADVFIFEP